MTPKTDDRFEKIFRYSPVAMALTDASDFKTIDVNTAFELLYGYTKEEIAGKTSGDVNLYYDKDQSEQILSLIKNNIPLRNRELNIRRKDGQKRTILLNNEFLEIDGKHCILSVSQDLTFQKEAEEAVRESENRFRIMADSSPYLIWVNDRNGRVQFVNNSYLEFFGVTMDKLLNENWVPFIHPDDTTNYIDEYFTALKERRTFKAEARVKDAGGGWRWIHSHGEPRFSSDGEYIGHIGSSNDITEQKILEQSILESEEKYRG